MDPWYHVRMQQGIGIYLRGLTPKKHGDPEEAAKKAVDHGVSQVFIMGPWQEPKNGRMRILQGNLRRDWLKYADAFANAGVSVGIWGYPWVGGEVDFVESMKKFTRGPVTSWLLDPEVGYKWKVPGAPNALERTDDVITKGGITEGPETSEALIRKCASELVSLSKEVGVELGLTSYGVASWHRQLPWNEFTRGIDFFSPQLYSVEPRIVTKGLEDWRQFGSRVPMVPSVPLFGKKSGSALHEHLSSFIDTKHDVQGFIFWSWRQASKEEWKTIERWASWIESGVCSLGGTSWE